MRPELDATDFIQFNYWDGGRKGLLSGEALYLDLKRMEMAYHDNNKRELELTRHVSLRQLDPLALLALKITGTCTVTIPEWLYDRDCPGHYMRRIKTVALSIPSVVGPYTSVNCTLTPAAQHGAHLAAARQRRLRARSDAGRHRFVDYFGATESIVTSGGTQRQRHVRDQPARRALPAVRGRRRDQHLDLDAAGELPAFDYSTISDVILHVRYTAREAGDSLGQTATKELLKIFADAEPLASGADVSTCATTSRPNGRRSSTAPAPARSPRRSIRPSCPTTCRA